MPERYGAEGVFKVVSIDKIFTSFKESETKTWGRII